MHLPLVILFCVHESEIQYDRYCIEDIVRLLSSVCSASSLRIEKEERKPLGLGYIIRTLKTYHRVVLCKY